MTIKKYSSYIIAGFILIAWFAGFWSGIKVHADTISFDSNLYYGITNNQDVTNLQTFLTAQGDYSGPITGNFYGLTKKAVVEFQANNRLPETGYFGVLSRGVANGLLYTQVNQSASQGAQAATSTATGSTDTGNTAPSPTTVLTVTVVPPSVSNQGSSAQSTPVSAGEDSTSAAVATTTEQPAQATPAPAALACTFNATTVLWPQGTQHAQFSWSYTQGATAKIIDGNGAPVSTFRAANQPQGIIENPNLNDEQDLYGPSIFTTTLYTLLVTEGQSSTECASDAVVQ